jgi:hypothetical protein
MADNTNVNSVAKRAAENSLNLNVGSLEEKDKGNVSRENVNIVAKGIAENAMNENARRQAAENAMNENARRHEENDESSDEDNKKVKNWLNEVLKDNNAFLNFLAETKIEDDVKKIILGFANKIDHDILGYTAKTELDYTHNDDIFMLYFLIKYGGVDADNLNLIHIGWSLSKIVIISSFRSIQYVIEDPIEEENKKNLLKIDLPASKHAFLLKETLEKIWKRSVNKDFEAKVFEIYKAMFLKGSKDVQLLEKFFSAQEPNEYIKPDISNLLNKIPKEGGKNKKSTKERINFNGKNRIVYVGPKGGRYIKNGGDFVRIK